MKRLCVVLSIVFLVVSISSSQAMARAKNLPLTATASSYDSSYTSPDKAVDGLEYTYWLGKLYQGPWWITFDAGSVSQIDSIHLTWYIYMYPPPIYEIHISMDGAAWEAILPGVQGSGNETRTINRRARYIKLLIPNRSPYMPCLMEFTAYTELNLPNLMRFQGILKDEGGVPLNGTYNATFRMYDSETGGAALWVEDHNGLTLQDGLLDVELGGRTALTMPFDKQYWIGVEIENDGEMTPRFKLTAAPYAFIAKE